MVGADLTAPSVTAIRPTATGTTAAKSRRGTRTIVLGTCAGCAHMVGADLTAPSVTAIRPTGLGTTAAKSRRGTRTIVLGTCAGCAHMAGTDMTALSVATMRPTATGTTAAKSRCGTRTIVLGTSAGYAHMVRRPDSPFCGRHEAYCLWDGCGTEALDNFRYCETTSAATRRAGCPFWTLATPGAVAAPSIRASGPPNTGTLTARTRARAAATVPLTLVRSPTAITGRCHGANTAGSTSASGQTRDATEPGFSDTAGSTGAFATGKPRLTDTARSNRPCVRPDCSSFRSDSTVYCAQHRVCSATGCGAELDPLERSLSPP